jgi:hypothetical protein
MLNLPTIYSELFGSDLAKEHPGTDCYLESTHVLIINAANKQQRHRITDEIAENIESFKDFKTIKIGDSVTDFCLEIPVAKAIQYNRQYNLRNSK